MAISRKGLGQGKGCGYRNILNNDSRIHAQASKGIKQPQKIKMINSLFGGKADKLPDSYFNKSQLKKGIAVEMEHTNNPEIAKEIAKDHLTESKLYYEALEDMEKGLKLSNNQRYIESLDIGKVNRLPVQVGIIVPSTNYDQVLTAKQFNKRVEDTKIVFDKMFGGDTSIKSLGSYWDEEKKKLIKEQGVLVESSMSIETYNKNKKAIEDYVKKSQNEWKQQTILVKVEGQNFIYPYKDFIDDDKKQKPTILVS